MTWSVGPMGAALALAAQGVALPGCASGSGGLDPGTPDADLRILFVGNSLTYTNDLPNLVRWVGERAGRTLAVRAVAFPDYSLEDHWRQGTALEAIGQAWADVVVLHQGPSSLPENQLHLRRWAARFADEIREAGARPALLMVWPSRSRLSAFDAVADAYQAAADSARALFVPAGQAWRAVWRRDPEVELYGPDGFHPGPVGSLVAALTVYRIVVGEPLSGLPETLDPDGDGPGPPLASPGLSEILYGAVEEAVGEVAEEERRSSGSALSRGPPPPRPPPPGAEG